MKKYSRISCGFTLTGAVSGLNEDAVVNEDLNKKLQYFLEQEKVKDFRIINTETIISAGDEYSPAYNRVCLHIEYEV